MFVRYGLETARHFHAQGWKVVATMRTPREGLLPRSERLRVVALDVTRPASIAAALETSGPIDVLVNNAGIGLMGAFEATPMTTVREVFETNTLGVMAMTQAVLPQLRARRSGAIVNVTSSATLAPFPLVAVYTASKMAIEGFTASLALELADFDVRVKLVEPGYGPSTSFTSNGMPRMDGLFPAPYAPFAERVFAMVGKPAAVTTETTSPRPCSARRMTRPRRCVSRLVPTPWRSPGRAEEPAESGLNLAHVRHTREQRTRRRSS